MESLSRRHPSFLYIGIAALGLLVFSGLGTAFIRASGPTYDEPVHLAAGYTDIVDGRYRLNARDHPPFGEMWASLPLLGMRLRSFRQSADWLRGRDQYNYADLFLYRNDIPADQLLNTARTWSLITWGALLALGLAEWSSRLWGASGAAWAMLFFAFSPPLISNASLVTTDMPAAALYFATFWVLSRRPRKTAVWAAAGAAMGLALASKFSMPVLPLAVLVCLLSERKLRVESPSRRSWLLMGAAALLVVAAVYRFRYLPLYFDGLAATSRRINEGRSSFLWGSYSTTGSLLYFPLALLIKTPLPALAFAALGLALWLGAPDAEGLWRVFPAFAYFIPALFSKTQIGYRHILPVYPFLVLWAAHGGTWLWRRARPWRAAAAAMAVWLIIGVLRVSPYQLAYFNELAGGPAGGYRFLADSNLDWGQDLKALAAELRRLGNPPVLLAYFGVGDPSYYGIHYLPMGVVTNVDSSRRRGDTPLDYPWRYVAVSETNLQGVYYVDKKAFSWLKDLKPIARPGWSIFLYDLKGRPEAQKKLAAMLGLRRR